MYSKDSDSQSSTTKSGINTQNIIIKDEAEQLKRTGKTVQEEIAAIKTDISTDNAESQSGKLENRFDKNALQKELNVQVEATKGFVQTASAAGNAIANKLGEEAVAKQREAQAAQEVADRAYKANPSKENETALNTANQNLITANNEADKWQTGGEYKRKIDGAMNAISAALGGLPAGGIVTSALSPEINHQIKLATEGSPMANKVAHALWGAVEAYSANQNAAAGASGALAGEVMADVIAKDLYGKKPNQLNREEKEVVSSVSQAAGALVGGMAANSSQGIGVGLTTAKNAVENNFLSDASRARLNALKTKYHRGEKLTNKEKLEFRDLIESDQRSDVLLDKFRKDPNSLNSKEREAFLSYVDRYYIETVTGNTASGYKLAPSTSLVNAQNRFESEYLINDPVPKRDYGHFPFAGTDAQRSQAVNTLSEESKNWLGWRSEKHSRDEDMYYTVKNELDAPENYKNSSNGKIAYSVKDGLEAGSMLALGSGTAVVRGVALMEKTAATVGGEAIALANKGGQVLRLSEDLATKAYINGQLTYVNLVDKGIKAYSTASTKAANAYINGQLAYADAIAKGVNTAKIAAREGVEGTRELVSQGIYYSYRPAELFVDTGKSIASMPKAYKTALGVSTGAGVAGESFYYMDGSKSLSNPVDVLGSVYNVGVNAAYDSAFYTANPLQSLGLDTLKGIVKDNKDPVESGVGAARSGSASIGFESIGKKLGLSEPVTKFMSSGFNNFLDQREEKMKSKDKE